MYLKASFHADFFKKQQMQTGYNRPYWWNMSESSGDQTNPPTPIQWPSWHVTWKPQFNVNVCLLAHTAETFSLHPPTITSVAMPPGNKPESGMLWLLNLGSCLLPSNKSWAVRQKQNFGYCSSFVWGKTKSWDRFEALACFPLAWQHLEWGDNAGRLSAMGIHSLRILSKPSLNG